MQNTNTIIKRIYLYLYLTIISFSFSAPLNAQQIIAKRMPFLEQLPSNEILDLHQDKNGFIWLGTKNGLARYDGYQLQSFRSDFSQPNLLTDDFVWCLAEDNNCILIGTRKGVNLLDKNTYQIRPFPDETIGSAWTHDIFVDSKGRIWVAQYSSVYQCNPDYTVRKSFDSLLNNAPGNGINSICEDNQGNIWVCTWGGGLHKYQEDTDSFMAFPAIGKNNAPFKIFQDKDNQYWILTWGDGIYYFNPEAPKDKMYIRQEIMNEKLNLPETAFFSVVQDDVYGYIWIFGYLELYAFKAVNGHLEKVDLSTYMFDYNKMFSQLIKDREGNLWAGAYDSGYHLVMGNPTIKNNFLLGLKNHVGFDTNITTLCVDPDNGLWFSQERWGLCWYDVQQDKFYDYSDKRPGLHNVGFISRSNRPGEFWMGCRDAANLYKVKLNSKREIGFLEEKDLYAEGLRTGKIAAIYEDTKNNLWLATDNQLYIKPSGKDFITPDVSFPSVVSIAEDDNGTIWLGSDQGGLYKVSFTEHLKLEKHYTPQNSALTSNNIENIIYLEDDIWICTSQGSVIKFNIHTEDFNDLSASTGMIGDPILGMKRDGHILWILTNRQITAYDTQLGTNIQYSNSDESIQINSFKKNVIDIYAGKLYVGGHGGFVSMLSSQLHDQNKASHPVMITDIKVSNNSFFFSPTHQLPDISTSRVILKPGDNNLEIFFSALQFTATSRIKYAYKMEGVDQDWVYPEAGKRTAFYNKIPKGDHIFMVRSTDEYGYWKDDITRLQIYKEPAWYETWWAYVAYVIASVLILFLAVFYYLRRARLSDQIKFQKELTKTKLEYFTNMSHELLTPLTTIGCVAEDMESTASSPKEDIHILKSNVLRLKRLIQQVLDFRKVENDSFVLNPTYGNITNLIREIYHVGIQPVVEKKGIHFQTHFEEEDIWGYMDFDKIDKVLYNILSNATKYTPGSRMIELTVSTIQNNGFRFLKIKVADEGIGIEQKEISKIFTPFYINKTAYASQSNGIGLSLTKKLVSLHKGEIHVESKVGEGSTFTIIFPIDRECYPEVKDIIETVDTSSFSQPEEPVFNPKEGTVLLVDDNEEFLRLMKKMLKHHYNVYTATNGQDALDIVSAEEIDIMVTDFMMPGMTGPELCETIKKDIRTSHIPVLMLTAKNSVEDQVICYNAGANGYLTKPFEMKMLYARIDNLIKSNQKRQQKFRTDTEINVLTLGYQTADEQFLKNAIQCIEKHLIESEFDMDAFASELNVSKSTLNRKIKAMTGLAPVEFVRNIRLKHACLLLKKPFVNVAEVAYTVGYSNPRYFAKCFKDEFGMTPSEYQKDGGN